MSDIDLKPGDKISTNVAKGNGSVGCFVRCNSDKLVGNFLLTNCHVTWAQLTGDHHVVVTKGNAKVFKGAWDANDRVEIGVVYKALTEYNHKVGFVDWSLVQITNPNVKIHKTIDGRNGNAISVTKWTDPQVGMTVAKRGQRTHWTSADLTSIDSRAIPDFVPDYPVPPAGKGLVEVSGNVLLNPFAAPGDSGSVIYDTATNKIVALLFGGGDGITWAVPFRRILASMKDKTKYDWELA